MGADFYQLALKQRYTAACEQAVPANVSSLGFSMGERCCCVSGWAACICELAKLDRRKSLSKARIGDAHHL